MDVYRRTLSSIWLAPLESDHLCFLLVVLVKLVIVMLLIQMYRC